MKDIIQNIETIHQRIHSACIKCGRDSKDIKLLLATKTVSAENILVALKSGENLIAENKIQELKEKFETLSTIPHETHFIGHLQTNKVKYIAPFVSMIHSVDSLKLLQEINKQA